MTVNSPTTSAPTGAIAEGEPRRRRPNIDWLLVGILAFVAVDLAPSLHSAFRADDTWNSTLRGQLALTGESLPHVVWESGKHFILDSGRPNVLGTTEGTLTSWLFDTPVAYHAFILALSVAAAWMLYRFSRELGLPREACALVVVLTASAIQFRSFHDASLGYSGTIQIVLLLTLGSLILFLRGLRTQRRKLIILSLLVFLPCPLLYEGTYPFVALHWALALTERRGREAFRVALPFLALGFAFVIISYVARKAAPSVVPGYEVSSSPMDAVRTYTEQLFTPIPASNLFFESRLGGFFPLGGSPTKAELLAGAWRGLAVFVLVLWLGWRCAGRDGSRIPSGRSLGMLAVTGGLLWVTAPMIISLATKYQVELTSGRGHLPAYVQVFGWGLVMTATLLAAMRVASRRSALALALVLVGSAGLAGVAAAFVGYNNVRVVALEVPIVHTRDLLEQGASHGVLAELPSGSSVLFSEKDLHWNTGWFAQVPMALESLLREKTGRRYDGRITPAAQGFNCPTPPDAWPPPDCARLAPTSAWVRVRPRHDGGSVLVATLPPGTNARAMVAQAQTLRVYVSGDGEALNPARFVGLDRRQHPWNASRLTWRTVASGDNWRIYEAALNRRTAPIASTFDDSASPVDFTSLGAPSRIVRLFGAKELLP